MSKTISVEHSVERTAQSVAHAVARVSMLAEISDKTTVLIYFTAIASSGLKSTSYDHRELDTIPKLILQK